MTLKYCRKNIKLQQSVHCADLRAKFRYKVDFWKAIIRRSKKYGDEYVFVVAQHEDGVLYFDDVEYGFNISTVDENGRIITPGGSQTTLKEAIEGWFSV